MHNAECHLDVHTVLTVCGIHGPTWAFILISKSKSALMIDTADVAASFPGRFSHHSTIPMPCTGFLMFVTVIAAHRWADRSTHHLVTTKPTFLNFTSDQAPMRFTSWSFRCKISQLTEDKNPPWWMNKWWIVQANAVEWSKLHCCAEPQLRRRVQLFFPFHMVGRHLMLSFSITVQRHPTSC